MGVGPFAAGVRIGAEVLLKQLIAVFVHGAKLPDIQRLLELTDAPVTIQRCALGRHANHGGDDDADRQNNRERQKDDDQVNQRLDSTIIEGRYRQIRWNGAGLSLLHTGETAGVYMLFPVADISVEDLWCSHALFFE